MDNPPPSPWPTGKWASRAQAAAYIAIFAAFCIGSTVAMLKGFDILWFWLMRNAPWAPGVFLGWIVGMFASIAGISWRTVGCGILVLCLGTFFTLAEHPYVGASMVIGAWSGAGLGFVFHWVARLVEERKARR